MPKYEVVLIERVTSTYVVEAESPHEAETLAWQRQAGPPVYSETLECEEIQVSKLADSQEVTQ
jgi:hypothetical protein